MKCVSVHLQTKDNSFDAIAAKCTFIHIRVRVSVSVSVCTMFNF